MSRIPVPLVAADISLFARSLASQLEGQKAPTHLQLMNILARAAGQKNYQHLLATQAAKNRIDSAVASQEPVDFKLVELALRCFNDEGVMVLWPAKRQTQILCLWPLWAAFPKAENLLTETQANAVLNKSHSFGDAALLRRELWSAGLVARNLDCSDYRRVEIAPTADGRELIRKITERRKLKSATTIFDASAKAK